jgi:glutamine synthetase
MAGSCRVENRLGGADLNPNAAFACCLGAGIRGMRKELPLAPPIEGNAYQIAQVETVPGSLREACEVAAAAPELRESFGAAFIDNLVRIAAFEASACGDA